jgi:hypothetical protein
MFMHGHICKIPISKQTSFKEFIFSKIIMQAGSSAFGFTKFFLGSMRHNDYYFHNFFVQIPYGHASHTPPSRHF